MLIFTVSVAIGASVSQIDISHWLTIFVPEQTFFRQPVQVIKTGFGGGFLAVMVFWLCLGLVHQVRDIRAYLKANPLLERQRRTGGQIAIFWRVGVVAALAAYLLLLYLVDMHVLVLPEPGVHEWKAGAMLREAVFLLLLLVLVGSVPVQNRIKLPRIVRQIVRGLFVALIIYYLTKTFVHELVTIAIMGYDLAAPLSLAPCNPRLFARTIVFFSQWSLASAFVVLANFFLLGQLARQWSVGAGRRLLCAILLALGIAENAVFVLWTMAFAYPTISPCMAETGGPISPHSWIALVVLAVIVSAVPAYRMSVERGEIAESSEISWRCSPHRYFHERRPILLLFAAAIGWIMADIFLEAYRNPSFPITEMGNAVFEYFFGRRVAVTTWDFSNQLFFYLMPVLFLWISLLLLTLHRTFSRRFDPRQPPADLPRVRLTKFATLWLATLAFTVFGSLAAVWISYGIWFNPWLNHR